MKKKTHCACNILAASNLNIVANVDGRISGRLFFVEMRMHDVIDYGNGLTCTVFDQPFKDYYELILDANLDNHRLAKNYKTDILQDMEFMCLWKMGDKSFMYGLQRDRNLPSNIARAFVRFYLPPSARDGRATPNVEIQHISAFYNDHPKYHQRLGIDTLFFTREVKGNRKDFFISSTVERNGFKKVDEPRLYRKTPQYFYVLGNSSFVTAFPLALVGPSK